MLVKRVVIEIVIVCRNRNQSFSFSITITKISVGHCLGQMLTPSRKVAKFSLGDIATLRNYLLAGRNNDHPQKVQNAGRAIIVEYLLNKPG